jgi:hypothetical protein
MGTNTTAPNFASIQAATLQLNANATSVASNRGGGNHGHLAITLHPDRYFELTGVHFEIPLNLPLQPVHPDPATAPVITEISSSARSSRRAVLLYKKCLWYFF